MPSALPSTALTALLLTWAFHCDFALAQDFGAAVRQQDEADLRRQVARHVEQLDSGTGALRQDAEAALERLGPDALPLLVNGDFGELSPEAGAALARIRDKLLADFVRRQLEPTRVTLSGDMSIEEALQSVATQASFPIDGGEKLTGRYTFQLADVELLRALDAIYEVGGLQRYWLGQKRGGIQVVARAEPADAKSHQPVDYEGSFRIAAEQCVLLKQFRNPAVDHMQLMLDVQWEPRLNLIALRQKMEAVRAECDATLPALDVRNAAQTIEAAVDLPAGRAELPLSFRLPPSDATRLTLLSGTLEALVAGPLASFAFDNVQFGATHAVRERGGISLELIGWEETDAGFAVELELRVPNDEALESFRNWPTKNEVYIDLGMGIHLHPVAHEILRQSAGRVGVRCVFTQDPSGATLVYRAPIAMTPIAIRYELREIILP